MKSILLIFVFVAFHQFVFAQKREHILLSDTTPSVGQKIKITYDPVGTPLEGNANFESSVYCFDGNYYEEYDIAFKPSKKIFKASFTIPANTRAFYLKLANGDTIDNNKGKGYIFLVYKQKEPVLGAYSGRARLFHGWQSWSSKIDPNATLALKDMEKEFAIYPHNGEDLYIYGLTLWGTKDLKATANVAAELAATGEEKNMINASDLYSGIGQVKAADSVFAAFRSKFAEQWAQKKVLDSVFERERDPAKKEKLYNDYLAAHPRMPTSTGLSDEEMHVQMALSWLWPNGGNVDQFKRRLTSKAVKLIAAGRLNFHGGMDLDNGVRLQEGAKLSKLAMDILRELIAPSDGKTYIFNKTDKAIYQQTYNKYADTYTSILTELKQFKKAITITKPIYKRSKSTDPKLNEKYVSMLLASKKYKEAITVLENAFKIYKTTPGMDTILKKTYTIVNRSDNGFDSYMAGIQQTASANMYAKTAKSLINQPCPAFNIKDVDDNRVSLTALRGKVVVLYFWSSYSQTNKSFPAIRLAINRQNQNADVKSFMVNAWSADSGQVDGLKNFMLLKNYNFQVLLDNIPNGDARSLFYKLHIKASPTVIAIDANGHIRFKFEADTYTADELAETASAMVKLITSS